MRVGVFGSSSKDTKQAYLDEAFRLGELLAERGYTCVNGAGKFGVMGALNTACSQKNGKIVGVIHSIFCVDAGEHPFIKDLLVVGGIDLYERKLQLFDASDCIMVLPGGVGTFDELWDGISSKSLGMKDMSLKPICIVNVDGFYDGSLQQLQRAHEDGILYQEVEEYVHVETNVADALAWCAEQVENSRKVPIDTHLRKIERMVAKNNNVPHPDPVEHFAVHREHVPIEVTEPDMTESSTARSNVSKRSDGSFYGSLALAASVGVLVGLTLARVCKCPSRG